MDNETAIILEAMLTSSKYVDATTKSAAIKRIRGQQEAAPSAPPLYRGVRRRNWGKWVSEIRELKKKSRIWLGSFETQEMAARSYDVAAFHLKGKKCALLNFLELVDRLPRPISLCPHDIQAAATEAVVAFHCGSVGNCGRSNDEYKRARRSTRKVSVCNESATTSSSDEQSTIISSDFETASAEVLGQTDFFNNSSSVLCRPTKGIGEWPTTDNLFESFSLYTDLAEALMLLPHPLSSAKEVDVEEHKLEEEFLCFDFYRL